jgi:branched-subunit amino acid aminotransferase/4-amino-4-deoxychorismate lyase
MNYGHFTAMQVRRQATRGLDLHLARLDAANREIFGTPLDGDHVRARIREALGDTQDASVRVIVEETGFVVTVRPPAPDPPSPQRLQVVGYQRPVAHLKHSGGFAQEYYGRRAERAGFDEILLTGPNGEISEGGITNVCFVEAKAGGAAGGAAGETASGTASGTTGETTGGTTGETTGETTGDGTLVWPDAPHLAGITMQLLENVVSSRHSPVHVDDLQGYEGGFVTNSHGVAVIASVDDLVLPVARAMEERLREAYAQVQWELI